MRVRPRYAVPRLSTIRRSYAKRASRAPDDSPEHSDLTSFIEYAERTSLSTTSTTYRGTLYEYVVLSSLKRLGFSLTRTGGTGDRGIDLLGTWHLPTLHTPMKVLVQCKFTAEKAQPRFVRELEGTFIGAPPGFRIKLDAEGAPVMEEDTQESENEQSLDKTRYGPNEPVGGVMALLATQREATKGVREAMGRSTWPMGFLKIGLTGNVEQLLWNRPAAERGLEGLRVSLRHKPRTSAAVEDDSASEDTASSLEKEVVLTFQDNVWEWKNSDDMVEPT